ncbi:MAG: T9SS type A sorting domain-containing protein [Flavobacteriales bacterium]|nr:T9SS type A sorting domain-containing protein [Flavobacteriales bacterium]
MTSKRIVLFIGLVLMGGSAAVVGQADHYCGTDKLHQELLATDPDYVGVREQLETFTKSYTQQNAGKKGQVYIIPIVFHIIHNFGSENINKQRILDGLRIINEDFRKTNSDTNQIVAAFKGIAADSEIEFRLAQKDPNGNCTDGITRTVSSQTMSADNGVKSLVRWPNDRYLNVWLVNTIASGAGGYAYYPGASSAIDGIVLRAGQFGPGYRSLTHEIGHYLNLPHTWGNSNDPEVVSNCGLDDGVGDTPNTEGNTSCFLTGVTCGTLDNVQNYMEYAFCDRMFTEGQKARMRAALNGFASDRNNLWKSANLVLTGTDGPDNLCNLDFSANRHVICVGTTIDFQDNSYNGQSGWSWGFPGGTPNSSSDPNPSITYNTPGIHDVSLDVTNGSDVISGTKPSYVLVQSEGDAMPLFESFEDFDFAEDVYWEVVNGDGGATWETIDYAGYSGNSSLKMDNYNGNEDERSDFLISPSLDLSNMQSAELSFKVAFAQEVDTTKDILRVYVSGNCGVSWALNFVESSSELATVSTTNSEFIPANASQWQEHLITLNSSFMVEGFKFKIEYIYGGGNNLYLDDINISGVSNTVPMLVSPYNGMSDQPVDLVVDWNSVDNVDTYEYEVDMQADFASPNLISGSYAFLSNVDNLGDTESSLTGLSGSTTYYWRARTVTNSVNSEWSAVWTFTTVPAFIGIEGDYLANFDFELYPNPTGGDAIITFSLTGKDEVEISMVDLMGREIQQIYQGTLPAGDRSQKIPEVETPGIYFVKIKVGTRLFVKKLVVN